MAWGPTNMGAAGYGFRDWPDGKTHTISYAQHLNNVLRGGAAPTIAPAGAAPAAPAYDPARDPLVPDSQLTKSLTDLARQRDDTITGLNTQANQQQRDIGFTAAGSFDPTDPYSRAALLKKSYDQQRRGAAQSMGAQGQLYSGGFNNTQSHITRKQLEGEDTLQKSLGKFLAEVEAKKAAAGTDYLANERVAWSDRATRAANSPTS